MGNFISMITNSNTQNSNLIYAAKNGDLDKVVQCLERGANIEAANRYGETALILAAEYDRENIVKLLLNHGANIEAVDVFGETALTWAAMNGHQTIVELLLNHGANIEAVDKWGNSALISAATLGYKTIVELLIYRGADINVADPLGNTAISCVIKGFFSPEHQNNDKLKDDYRETFKILAEHNAVINEETQAILDEKDERDELKQYTGCIERWVFK